MLKTTHKARTFMLETLNVTDLMTAIHTLKLIISRSLDQSHSDISFFEIISVYKTEAFWVRDHLTSLEC